LEVPGHQGIEDKPVNRVSPGILDHPDKLVRQGLMVRRVLLETQDNLVP